MNHQANDVAPMMSAREVGRLLQLPTATVWHGARTGRLPSVRIGRLVRFPRRAIEAIAAGEVRNEGNGHAAPINGA
jgi:excisionase family DNA binding protein